VLWQFWRKKNVGALEIWKKNNNVGALEIRKREIVIQNFGIDFLIKRTSEVKNFQSRIAFINTR